MGATLRAVLIGGLLGLLVLGGFAAVLVAGIVELPSLDEPAARLLVIAVAPDDVTTAAPFAFVLDAGRSSATLLDPSVPVRVPGSSALSARDAYEALGGGGVARALAPQTDGQVLQWVVLPPESWAQLVDRFGGIEVDVPHAMSSYRDGLLISVDGGRQRITGDEAVALASAFRFVEDDDARRLLLSQLGAGISSVTVARPELLADLVRSGAAQSSLDAETVRGFVRR
jgi:hypothetical protein